MNRATRRAAARHPQRLEARQVTQEVPVTLLAGADGKLEAVAMDTAESCFACRCCAIWARDLDTLAGHIRTHEAGYHDPASCLVCQLLAGQFQVEGESCR